MGLDMYLYAKLWASKYSQPENNKKLWELAPFKPIENFNYAELKLGIGYWRKANHIHKWFVDNVQDGEDDCGNYYVSRNKLKELLEICEKIEKLVKLKEGNVVIGRRFTERSIEKIKAIAKELLPTREGFFFGETEYNEYYLNDIQDTIKIIKRCLKLPKEWSFEYHSNW